MRGALILSCSYVDGELELQQADSDSNLFEELCAFFCIEVQDKLVQQILHVDTARASILSFLSQPFMHYLICGVFHGVEGSGAWKLSDGELHFEDIAGMWTELGHDKHPSSSLFILSDSCFSGFWARKAARKQIPGISVQASCGANFTCNDEDLETFTSCWCSAHAGCQKSLDVEAFFPKDRLDIQQPTYYFCESKRRFLRPAGDFGQSCIFAGIGEEECNNPNGMRVVPKANHCGAFTPAVKKSFKNNFIEIWSGLYSHDQILGQQRKRLEKLELRSESLRSTIAYLFQLQYISDMKTTYPRNDAVDDPFQLGLEDLLAFQREVQENKELECRHHSMLGFLANVWYLMLMTVVIQKSELIDFKVENFQKCRYARQVMETAWDGNRYDSVLWEEVLLARVMFDRMVIDCNLWQHDDRPRSKIYNDICTHCGSLAQEHQSNEWFSEMYVQQIARNNFKALTTNSRLELQEIQKGFFTADCENNDEFTEVERLRVKFSRLINGVDFFLNLRFRAELGSDLGTSEIASNLPDFEFHIGHAAERLYLAAIELYRRNETEGMIMFRLEVQKVAYKCQSLVQRLCGRDREVQILEGVVKQLLLAMMYMQPEMTSETK